MPNCAECKYFDKSLGVCAARHNKLEQGLTTATYQVRRCVNAILEGCLQEMSGRVLEVGFGVNLTCQRMVNSLSNAKWYGIDPRWKNKKRKAHFGQNWFRMSVDDIKFPDGYFDAVYASQTMEHWGEAWGRYRRPTATIDSGLAEIARVLKPGGLLFIDVPMLSHGGDIFVNGDEAEVLSVFKTGTWCDVSSESWGKDCSPLERFPGEEGWYVFSIRAVREKAV